MGLSTLPVTWQTLLLVMGGGALGAAGRYWTGEALLRQLGSGTVPWGTLSVNLAGSFAVGFLAIWLDDRVPGAVYWRAFLIVGVLGALTTYSALMLECLIYVRSQRTPWMAGYLLGSVVAGLSLVWAGARCAELLKPAG